MSCVAFEARLTSACVTFWGGCCGTEGVMLCCVLRCRAAAGFLQEGSLDTRTYGKRVLWAVKAALRGNRADMDRLMSGG